MAQLREMIKDEPNAVVEKVLCPVHLTSPEESGCVIYTGRGKSATSVPNELFPGLPKEWCPQMAPNGRLLFYDINTNNEEETIVSTRMDADTGLPAWVFAPVSQLKWLGPLPCGWDQGHNKDGQVYFIDHNRKIVQTEDPRWGNGYVPPEGTQFHCCTAESCNLVLPLPPDHYPSLIRIYWERFSVRLRALFKKIKPRS